MGMEGTLLQLMGIVVSEATPDRVVATMPVKGNTQPYGLLHGGASCVLAESLGSIGSALHAAGYGKVAVGVDINATHHRAVREGDRHRGRHADLPRPDDDVVRGGHHRRPGQAGLHRADHVPADSGSAG